MSTDDFNDAPAFVLIDAFGNESRPVRAIRGDDGGVRLQDGRRMGYEEFSTSASRCDETGIVICRQDVALYQQVLSLRRAAARGLDGVKAHVADVEAVRRTMGMTPSVREFDRHVTDVVSSRVRDHVVRQEDLGAEAVAAAEEALAAPVASYEVLDMNPVDVQTPDKVIARMQRDTGISADRWIPVKSYPTYMIEQIRGAAREMLRPILGNSAALEDLRRIEIPKSEVERYQAIQRWVSQAEDKRDLPPFRHPSMPTYETSAAVLAEMNGVTLLVFSDFHANYAYAWQTDPDMAPELDAPRGPGR